MRNIVHDAQFLSDRAEELAYFEDQFQVPEETEMIVSPSGSSSLKSIIIRRKVVIGQFHMSLSSTISRVR